MLRRNDGSRSLQQPASPFNQHVVSKFLKIKPKILGAFEISLGILLFTLTIWERFFYLLWSPLIMILTGAFLISAARTHNICRVRTSQFLNCFIVVMAAISIIFHFIDTHGITSIVLVVCDVLIFIFSMIVVSSFCECCRTKSRRVAVSYVNTAGSNVTVSNIVVFSQHGPSAPPPSYTVTPSAPPPSYTVTPSAPPPSYTVTPYAPPPSYTVTPYAPQPSYSVTPYAPQPSYSVTPYAPPPSYTVTPYAPPPSYSPAPSAPPPNYSTLHSAPPPHYNR